jgi:hypothetical protein
MITTATIAAGVVLTARVKVLREINEMFTEVEVITGNGGWSKPGKVLTVRTSIMSDIREEKVAVAPRPAPLPLPVADAVEGVELILVEAPQIVEARTTLARLSRDMVANFQTPGGGRGKQGLQRTDAQIRRGARYARGIQAAESWLNALLRATERVAQPSVTPERLRTAVAVKTRFGWHRVVRVNAKTVTVATPYSWTDRIALAAIVDIR